MSSRSGSALLAVLWLSAVLSVIALTVASTVRGEVERAATASDDTRAYFLAESAIQRAILYITWGAAYRPVTYYLPGMGPLYFKFPGGEVTVDVIPESSKINISQCLPADLFRLLLALDVPPDRAQVITAAAMDWRTALPIGQVSPFDLFYLQQNPSFTAPHASFQDIEEMLLVRGMTPELFYGTWERDDQEKPPRLVQRIGLRDCISVYANGSFDVNNTPLPVLIAAGLAPADAAAIVQQRAVQRFVNYAALQAFTQNMGPAARRVVIGGTTLYTIRATARPYTPNGVLSDMRHTTSALVKFAPPETGLMFQILRWYDRG
jgi:general secretion pathway protein K